MILIKNKSPLDIIEQKMIYNKFKILLNNQNNYKKIGEIICIVWEQMISSHKEMKKYKNIKNMVWVKIIFIIIH